MTLGALRALRERGRRVPARRRHRRVRRRALDHPDHPGPDRRRPADLRARPPGGRAADHRRARPGAARHLVLRPELVVRGARSPRTGSPPGSPGSRPDAGCGAKLLKSISPRATIARSTAEESTDVRGVHDQPGLHRSELRLPGGDLREPDRRPGQRRPGRQRPQGRSQPTDPSRGSGSCWPTSRDRG